MCQVVYMAQSVSTEGEHSAPNRREPTRADGHGARNFHEGSVGTFWFGELRARGATRWPLEKRDTRKVGQREENTHVKYAAWCWWSRIKRQRETRV